MIDINSIVGINMCAKDEASLWNIKSQIASVTSTLGPDDLFLIGDTCCRGADEATGCILNAKLCRRISDLIPIVKINFNAVGLTNVNCPKHVFIFTEKVDAVLEHEIGKMANINEQRHYECRLHILPIMRQDDLQSLPAKIIEALNGPDTRKEETSYQ